MRREVVDGFIRGKGRGARAVRTDGDGGGECGVAEWKRTWKGVVGGFWFVGKDEYTVILNRAGSAPRVHLWIC